ncbi:hypothetical protein [Flagellimonas abyssi]|nr:hypothetical protein [Allomuricauda abyssi]
MPNPLVSLVWGYATTEMNVTGNLFPTVEYIVVWREYDNIAQ